MKAAQERSVRTSRFYTSTLLRKSYPPCSSPCILLHLRLFHRWAESCSHAPTDEFGRPSLGLLHIMASVVRSMRRSSSRASVLVYKEKNVSNKRQAAEEQALAQVVESQSEKELSSVKRDAEENIRVQMAMVKIKMHRSRMRKQFWARMVLRRVARRWVARRQAMHEANDKVGRKIIQQKMSSGSWSAQLHASPTSEKVIRRKLSSSKPETAPSSKKAVFEAVAHRRWQATRHPESPTPTDEYSPYRKRTGRRVRTKEKQGSVMVMNDMPGDFDADTPSTKAALGSDAVSSAVRKPDMLAETWKEILSTVTCVRSTVTCVDQMRWAR